MRHYDLEVHTDYNNLCDLCREPVVKGTPTIRVPVRDLFMCVTCVLHAAEDLRSTGRLDFDPDPQCDHEWEGLGLTTICDPPVAHACCRKCRTFRHTQGTAVSFAKEWMQGPWTW